MPEEKVIASGLVERIGQDNAKVNYKTNGDKYSHEMAILDHEKALEEVTQLLLDSKVGVIENVRDVEVVAHRVVHGGKAFTETVKIDEYVKDKIRSLFLLAPLHNPANLKGIEVAEKLFFRAKQIAVFDTSFFRTLPEKVYRYALPKYMVDENNIRVYGFHGISHKYVSGQAYKYLNDEEKNKKLITIHLGNGCSMTAIENGKAVDHTLGYGPNEGLIMGTRSGSIDSSVIFALMKKYNYTVDRIADVMSKESGMLGLTGQSDMRDIEERAMKGDENCQLALEMNAYKIKKFIGAYAAAMNGVDAIAFTAGIGENSDIIRGMVCENMDFLGIKIDTEKNNVRAREITDISAEDSKVKVLIIPTNEELEIAEEAYRIL